jgi:lipopolysaccharide biosynthesis glycosyltransferase
MKASIYCTADDKFLDPAISALNSFRWAGADLFLLSDDLSETNMLKLYAAGIKYIECDIPDVFARKRKWSAVTFLQLAGPEIMFKRGYDYSLGIDADVLCIERFDIDDIFSHTKDYSGIMIRENNGNYMFRYPDSLGDMSHPKTNSGVVFWNNKSMIDFRLWEKAIETYKPNQFLYVEQSILGYLSKDLNLKILPDQFNFRVLVGGKVNPLIPRIKIMHFNGKDKPWDGESTYSNIWNKNHDVN